MPTIQEVINLFVVSDFDRLKMQLQNAATTFTNSALRNTALRKLQWFKPETTTGKLDLICMAIALNNMKLWNYNIKFNGQGDAETYLKNNAPSFYPGLLFDLTEAANSTLTSQIPSATDIIEYACGAAGAALTTVATAAGAALQTVATTASPYAKEGVRLAEKAASIAGYQTGKLILRLFDYHPQSRIEDKKENPTRLNPNR